ncbi:hypothetical protein ABZW38_02820 [Streptomyces bacillaris]|uniref:hypothetical protein n=1 Tax=Streptomyces bacillaris TaxID=68179 RepID=UPI0034612BC4
MPEVHTITSLGAIWRPGDVVLDAKGTIRVRSDDPHWVWDYPNEGNTLDAFGELVVPGGAVEEEYAVRPLTLLVRDGRAVGGTPVPE